MSEHHRGLAPSEDPKKIHAQAMGRRWSRQFYRTAAVVFALDQLAKILIRWQFAEGDSLEVVPGILFFTHVHNTGAAFGIMSLNTLFLTIVSIVVCLALIFWGRQLSGQGVWIRAGLSLGLGGALGNLADRVSRGYVTDFIDFATSVKVIRDYPVFNIADIALTTGAICICVYLLKDMRTRR